MFFPSLALGQETVIEHEIDSITAAISAICGVIMALLGKLGYDKYKQNGNENSELKEHEKECSKRYRLIHEKIDTKFNELRTMIEQVASDVAYLRGKSDGGK